MDQIPYSEGLRHCCPPDHISHITSSMEYGVWNRDYDLHKNGVDHLVAKKVDPSTETGKKQNHTHKKQPSKQIALQTDSPPNKMSCTLPRKKASQDIETEKSRLKRRRRR